MASRENLVPQQITDVNGKVTTVYRKPGASTGGERNIPLVPALTVPVAMNPRDRLLQTLIETMSLEEERDIHHFAKSLKTYSDDFILELDDLLADEDNQNLAISIAANAMNEEDETILKEFIFFAPKTGLSDMGEAFGLIRSMRYHDRFSGHRNFTTAPEDVQEDLAAVMGLTLLLDKYDVDEDSPATEYIVHDDGALPSFPHIIDEDLIDLALESRESFEKMCSVITENQTADPNAIKGIMSGIAPSIATGTL